jgi:hypothetical protein
VTIHRVFKTENLHTSITFPPTPPPFHSSESVVQLVMSVCVTLSAPANKFSWNRFAIGPAVWACPQLRCQSRHMQVPVTYFMAHKMFPLKCDADRYTLRRPCHGSGGHAAASHRGGPGSIPGQSVWDRWTKRHWDWFLFQYFGFACQYHTATAPCSCNFQRRCMDLAADGVL